MFVSRKAALALPVVLVFALGGCSLLEPSGTNEPLTGIAACALGHTWTQDFESLVPQVTEQLAANGVAATSVVFTGEQTFSWDAKAHVKIDSNYTVAVTTAPAEGQVQTVTETHAGSTTGAAYINGDVAIPRKWDDQTTVEAVADLNGEPLEAAPFGVPSTNFDDKVGLILTCDGETLTIHPRGSKLTQTWTRTD